MSVNPNNQLASFIRSEMQEQGKSYRDVANASRGLITYGTVFDVVNERTKGPAVNTVLGLARGLSLSPYEVFRIAAGLPPIEKPLVNEILAYLREMPESSLSSIAKIVRTFFEPGKQMPERHLILKGDGTGEVHQVRKNPLGEMTDETKAPAKKKRTG